MKRMARKTLWIALLFAAGAASLLAWYIRRPVRPRPSPPGKLERALEGPSSGRVEAIEALPEADVRRGATALAALAESTEDPETIQAILRALERGGGSESVRALHQIGRRLPSPEGAAVRLSRLRGRDAAPALLEVLDAERGEGALAAAAVRALGRTGLRSLLPRLLEAARVGKDPAVRVEAVEALGTIADPDALPLLVSLLEDPDGRIRQKAIRSLGRIRKPESVAALEQFLRGSAARAPPLEEVLAREALSVLRGEPLGPWGRNW